MSHKPTQPIAHDFEWEIHAPRYRIGVVALDTDLALEWDFHQVLPQEVAFYTSHIAATNPLTADNLKKMKPRLQAVVRSILPSYALDVVVYGCTSASIAIGYEGVKAEIQAVRPGVAVVTPSSAAIQGLQALGVQKITLVTPYVDEVNQMLRNFFESHHIEILNMSSFCLETDLQTAHIPPLVLQKAALAACHADAEGIFIACTAFRAMGILENLEAVLEKPALSSNQCLIWESLQHTGYPKPIAGYGKLLREK